MLYMLTCVLVLMATIWVATMLPACVLVGIGLVFALIAALIVLALSGGVPGDGDEK